MKKKFLLFVMVAALITGCDPHADYVFEIKNETLSEVTINIGGKQSVVIPVGEKKIVWRDGDIGSVLDPFDFIAMRKPTVNINDKLVSDDFWQRKYWEVKTENAHSFTSLIILTDDLIEILIVKG